MHQNADEPIKPYGLVLQIGLNNSVQGVNRNRDKPPIT